MKLNQENVIKFDKLDGELKYYGDGMYQLFLNQFHAPTLRDGKHHPLSVMLTEDQIPEHFRDEEPIFEVGEHVDKKIHKLHGNYAGEIINIINKNEGKVNSPRRWKYEVKDVRQQYYQDHWYEQWEITLAVNPQND